MIEWLSKVFSSNIVRIEKFALRCQLNCLSCLTRFRTLSESVDTAETNLGYSKMHKCYKTYIYEASGLMTHENKF